MKKIGAAFVLCALLGGRAAAQALPDVSLRCVTGLPTTSFILEADGDDVVLTTIHHNGTGYMPIHEGVVVPNDMAYLAAKSKLLQKMGDLNKIRFPRSRCTVYGKGLINCAGGERRMYGDVEIEALSFTTSQITKRVFDLSHDFVKATLSVNITNHPPVQEITMFYDAPECRFGF